MQCTTHYKNVSTAGSLMSNIYFHFSGEDNTQTKEKSERQP